MPRNNREYLMRYCEQALNDIERGLERLKMLSDAYGGVYRPLDGDVMPVLKDVPDEYEGKHGLYQKYVDMVAIQIMAARDDLITFKTKFM